MSMSRFNVVFFCTDQQRWDQVGYNGNSLIRTPTIDKLANNGVVFDNHIASCPFCMPSRATFFTGQYHRNNKLWNHFYRLNHDRITTLADVFARNGYATHSCGKLHLNTWGEGVATNETPEHPDFWTQDINPDWKGPYLGFEGVDLEIGHGFSSAICGGHYTQWVKKQGPGFIKRYAPDGDTRAFLNCFNVKLGEREVHDLWKMEQLDEKDHHNSWVSRKATEYINSNKENPFFLWVSYPDPHHPFSAPYPYCNAYNPASVPLPLRKKGELDHMPSIYREASAKGSSYSPYSGRLSDATMRGIISQSYGMVEHIDDCINRVVKAVEKNGLLEKTIFVFTTDHGEMLGNHGLIRKSFFGYRDLLRTPFFISGKPIEALIKRKKIGEYSSHIDIMPTLLSICGLSTSAKMDGLDLLPVINGGNIPRDMVMSEWEANSRQSRQYCQHLFYKNFRLTIFPNNPEWVELFDFSSDPNEFNNQAANPKYGEILEFMKKALNDRFPPVREETDILPFYRECSYYDELKDAVKKGRWATSVDYVAALKKAGVENI